MSGTQPAQQGWSSELSSAVREGRTDDVRALLDTGVNSSTTSPVSVRESYIHEAIERGHDAVFSLLLDRGTDPNLCIEHGNPPLVTAVWHRRIGMIASLLSRGADPSPHVYLGGTTILDFAYKPRPYENRSPDKLRIDREICKKLLSAGSDPNARDSRGWTFIMQCCDDLELVDLAFDCGAQINLTSPDGTPILYWFYNHADTLKLAIEKGGADIEARDRNQLTHLMVACRNGRLEAAKLFIEKGANAGATAPALYGEKGRIDAYSLAKAMHEKGEGPHHEEILRLVSKHRPGLFSRLFAR